MGMYTGLRVKAKIKEDFLQQLENVLSAWDTGSWEGPWAVVDFVKFPFVENFSKMGRSSMIPYGAVCYMPDDWEYVNTFEDGVWTFCCSLKNYNSEIEIFLNDVLVNIAEWAHVEKLYEEEIVSALFNIHGGVLHTVRESEWSLDE